jgi:DNA-binding NarL/FixJ family response regulator
MTNAQTAGGTKMPNLMLMAEPINVVLLEDHPLYREGLKTFVRAEFPTANFVYDGADAHQARSSCDEHSVSIAIVDLHLGDGRSPGEIVTLFSSKKIPVLVISALSNFESVKSAFQMGAKGFVSKDSSTEEIKKAIKTIVEGNEFISPILNQALNFTSKTSDELSAQERKALVLYASGLKLEAVARRMNVAPSTVKQYIERAKMKYKMAGTPIRTKTDMYRTLRDEGVIQ